MTASTTNKPKVQIMGVLNVTPDSFSDGGRFDSPETALEHAQRLVEAGAHVIDVGAESSRPGASPLPEDEEWRRLEPVLKGLLDLRLPAQISIDTRKPELMLRCAGLGANIINDIGGAADRSTLECLSEHTELQYIAMHMHGEPETMQLNPLRGSQAVRDVDGFFQRTFTKLIDCGFSTDRIWLDPGIGFGKDDSANMKLLGTIRNWSTIYRLTVGISRKGFIGRLLGIDIPAHRDAPSKMLELGLVMAGVKMIRTHEVARLAAILRMMED